MNNLRCVIADKHRVVIDHPEPPPLGSGDVRIRTELSLVSPGTEGAMFNMSHIGFPDPENLYAKYPFYPGYAAVGDVIDAAPDAKGVKTGDRVFYYGRHERIGTASTTRSVVLKLPAGLDPRLAPFARLAEVSYTALAATDGAPKDGLVVVVGLGMIGNFAAQLYRRAGSRVVALDTIQARVDWARACGLPNSYRVESDLTAAILHATKGEKPQVVVEATGVGALVEPCLRAVAYHGYVVLLGSPREPATIDTYKWIHRTAARLVGAHVNLVPVVSETGIDQVKVSADILGAMVKGEIIAEPLISRTIQPENLQQSYFDLEQKRDSVIGVLIDWGRKP